MDLLNAVEVAVGVLVGFVTGNIVLMQIGKVLQGRQRKAALDKLAEFQERLESSLKRKGESGDKASSITPDPL